MLRQDQNGDCNIAMTWIPEGKRRRGRPKDHPEGNVKMERAEAGWRSWEEFEVKTVAANRGKWRDSVKALCPMRHEEER